MFYSVNGMTLGSPELSADDLSDLLAVINASTVDGTQYERMAGLKMKVRYLLEQAMRAQYHENGVEEPAEA